MRLTSIIAVVVAATLGAGPAGSGDLHPRTVIGSDADTSTGSAWTIQVEPVYPLEPVTTTEMTGVSREYRSTGARTGAASFTGRGFTADFGGAFSQAELTPEVRRRLTGLWQLRIPPDMHPADIRVRYEVVAPDGRVGSLRHRESDHHIPATVHAEPVRILRHEGPMVVIEGAAELVVDITDLRRAGRYGGTIRVTVEPR